MNPYYSDDMCELYLGDSREVLPALDITADVAIADPPYGDTSLPWDRWPDGWVDAVADVTRSLWCFGSMRMFFKRHGEFDAWKLAQDVVWEKHNGSGFTVDRFKRVHETVTHWYQGPWSDVHHQVPRISNAGARHSREGDRTKQARAGSHHLGTIGEGVYVDDGLRMARSVLYARSMNRLGIHPTQKPVEILSPLISYSTPGGGLVLDPFAGSGATLVAARELGRRAIGVEASEEYCEAAAKRLAAIDSQPALPFEVTA